MKKNINGIPITDRWTTGNPMTKDFPIDEVEITHNHITELIDENDEIGQEIDDIFGR